MLFSNRHNPQKPWSPPRAAWSIWQLDSEWKCRVQAALQQILARTRTGVLHSVMTRWKQCTTHKQLTIKWTQTVFTAKRRLVSLIYGSRECGTSRLHTAAYICLSHTTTWDKENTQLQSSQGIKQRLRQWKIFATRAKHARVALRNVVAGWGTRMHTQVFRRWTAEVLRRTAAQHKYNTDLVRMNGCMNEQKWR